MWSWFCRGSWWFSIFFCLSVTCLCFGDEAPKVGRIESLTTAIRARFSRKAPVDPVEVPPTSICASLLDFWTVPGALKISHYSMNAERTDGNSVLTPSASHGLLELIKHDGGWRIILDNLLRLSLVDASAADPNYAELMLAGENREVDLLETHPDPAVEQYIKDKFRPQIRAGLRNRRMLVNGANGRATYFFDQVIETFMRVSDSGSRNALIVAFTEIDRQVRRFRDTRRITRETFDERVKGILAHLNCIGLHRPRPLSGLPDWAYETAEKALDVIPVVNLAGPIAKRAYERYIDGDLQARRQPFDPKKAPNGMVLIPGTLRLFIVGRDFYHLEPKARRLFSSFAAIPFAGDEPGLNFQPSQNLFSSRFAQTLAAAFPETDFVRLTPKAVTNRFGGDPHKRLDESVFGKTSYEGHKLMARSALFLALLRGESSYFPNVSEMDFRRLRRDLIQDLGLADSQSGEFYFERVNAFFTFLMEDAVGRGDAPILRELDGFHRIRERVGTDWERATLRFLKAYPFVSSSFARLPDEVQEDHLLALQATYYFNPGETIRLLGNRNAFRQLEGMPKEILTLILYRSLLSHTALRTPMGEETRGTTFTSSDLMGWEALRSSLYSLSDDKMDSETAYTKYLAWVAENLKRPLALPINRNSSSVQDQVTTVRLARQSGSTADQMALVEAAFASLSEEERAVHVRFSLDHPSLTYGSSELFHAILNQVSEPTRARTSTLDNMARGYRAVHDPHFVLPEATEPREAALRQWMRLLARIYTAVEREDHFPVLLTEVESHYELRIHVGPLVRALKELKVEDIESRRLGADFSDNAYEVSVER